jgi:hypothetical protein
MKSKGERKAVTMSLRHFVTASSHALFGLWLVTSAALAQPSPALLFEAPKGFTGSLGRDPSAHVSMSGDATVNVYPFRRLNGPFAEQFRRTLLRELLVPDSREVRLAGTPVIEPLTVPGAEAAMFAKFVEDRFGVARYRLRVAIYSAGAVALVDYSANGPDAYQRNWPAMAGVLDSLKVGVSQAAAAPASAPPASGAGGGGADGLFLASTHRFMPTIGGPPGSGSWQLATRFYLLSPDGRFHRGYGLPSVPGGDVRTFDYAKAEREDAPNTGTYTVNGSRVVMRTRSGDAIEGRIAGGELAIDNMTFKRAALK